MEHLAPVSAAAASLLETTYNAGSNRTPESKKHYLYCTKIQYMHFNSCFKFTPWLR